jgi:hypothetical protein
MSMKSRVAEEKQREAQEKPEWDKSTTTSKRDHKKSAEERVAAKIASEMIRDNQKLRGIHSNTSIKKIIEKEAKRQLLIESGGEPYDGPQVSRILEKGQINRADPSNLPYLHKCPAV